MSQSKQLKRLIEVNLKPVEAMETYFIDDKLHVSKQFLAKFYGIDQRAVAKWEKENGFS